jgi:hypothetical protein
VKHNKAGYIDISTDTNSVVESNDGACVVVFQVASRLLLTEVTASCN